MNPTIELLLSHRSIRAFDPTPVSDEHVRLAVEAGQMASTSSAVQAYSVIRVRCPHTRAEIAALAGNQAKVADAGAFMVICGDTRRHRLACRRDGRPYDQRLEAFLVATIDTALFAEKMVVAFESMGYGICYIGGLRNDLPRLAGLLAIPEGVYPYFGLCVGVPAEQPSRRPRLPVPLVLHEDRYPDDLAVLNDLAAYDAEYERYLAERGAKDTTPWSARMSVKYATPERPGLAAFYQGQGARLD
jgi:nitroreductase